MPYNVKLPDGRIVAVDDSVSKDEARVMIIKRFPELFKKQQGFLNAASSGLDSGQAALQGFGADIANRLGLGSIEKNLRERSRMNKLEASLFDPTTDEEVAAARDEGFFSGIGAKARQKINEPAGQMLGRAGPTVGGAALGAVAAMAAPAAVPIAVGTGATLGALGTEFGMFSGENMDRQREVNPNVEPSLAAATPAALVQAMLSVYGYGKFLKGAGATQQVMKEATALAPKVASGQMSKQEAIKELGSRTNKIITEIGSGTVVQTAAEIPQEALSRAQAGLPVNSPKARDEYGNIAEQMAWIGSVPGVYHGSRAQSRGIGEINKADGQRTANEQAALAEGAAAKQAEEQAALAQKNNQPVLDRIAGVTAPYTPPATPPLTGKAKKQWEAEQKELSRLAAEKVLAERAIAAGNAEQADQYAIHTMPKSRENAAAAFGGASPNVFGEITANENLPPEQQLIQPDPSQLVGPTVPPVEPPAPPLTDLFQTELPQRDLFEGTQVVQNDAPQLVAPANPLEAVGPIKPRTATKEDYNGLVYANSSAMRTLTKQDLSKPVDVENSLAVLYEYKKQLADLNTESKDEVANKRREKMMAGIDERMSQLNLWLENLYGARTGTTDRLDLPAPNAEVNMIRNDNTEAPGAAVRPRYNEQGRIPRGRPEYAAPPNMIRNASTDNPQRAVTNRYTPDGQRIIPPEPTQETPSGATQTSAAGPAGVVGLPAQQQAATGQPAVGGAGRGRVRAKPAGRTERRKADATVPSLEEQAALQAELDAELAGTGAPAPTVIAPDGAVTKKGTKKATPAPVAKADPLPIPPVTAAGVPGMKQRARNELLAKMREYEQMVESLPDGARIPDDFGLVEMPETQSLFKKEGITGPRPMFKNVLLANGVGSKEAFKAKKERLENELGRAKKASDRLKAQPISKKKEGALPKRPETPVGTALAKAEAAAGKPVATKKAEPTPAPQGMTRTEVTALANMNGVKLTTDDWNDLKASANDDGTFPRANVEAVTGPVEKVKGSALSRTEQIKMAATKSRANDPTDMEALREMQARRADMGENDLDFAEGWDSVDGGGSRLDKPLTDAIVGGKVSGVLDAVINGGYGTDMIDLAKRLAELNLDTKTDIGQVFDRKTGKQYAAEYDSANDAIRIDPARTTVREVLHEVVHAATVWAVETPTKLTPQQRAAVQRLQNVYAQLKADGKLKDYGMTNVKEFMAEAMTNPDFQAKLAAMNVRDFGSKTGMKRAWDAIVDAVRRILGFAKPSDLLSDVMKSTGALFDGAKEGNRARQSRVNLSPSWIDTRATNFRRWFGESKIVNGPLTDEQKSWIESYKRYKEDVDAGKMDPTNMLFQKAQSIVLGGRLLDYKEGAPKIMYHGTAQDISAFRAKQAGAIFVTPEPKFAETFANMSENWMQKNKEQIFTPEQIKAIRKTAMAKVREKETGLDRKDHLDRLKDDAEYKYDDYFIMEAFNNLPSRANIMPLYVKAEKPFDFDSEADVEAITQHLYKQANGTGTLGLVMNGKENFRSVSDIKRLLTVGDWPTIETEQVQRALKELGYDAFYVKEGGVKNLAVYDPAALKSATGNNGNFDPNDTNINYAPPANSPFAELGTNAISPEPTRGVIGAVTRSVAGLPASIANVRQAGLKGWINEAALNFEQRFADGDLGVTRYFDRNNATAMVNGRRVATVPALMQAAKYSFQLARASLATGYVAKNAEGTYRIVNDEDNNIAALARAIDALPENLFGKDKRQVFNDIMDNLSYSEREAIAARTIQAANAVIAVNEKQIRDARKLTGAAAANQINEARSKIAAAENEIKKATYERPANVTDEKIRLALQAAQVPEVARALEINREMNRRLIDLMESSDLIDPDKANEWRQNQYYVPLRRVFDEDEQTFGQFQLGTGGARTPTEKKFRGSDRMVGDIVENLIMQRLKIVDAAMRNNAAVKSLRALEGMNVAGVRKVPKKLQGVDNIVTVKVAGQPTHYIVEDKNALKTYSGMTEATPEFMDKIESVTRLLREAIMLSPDAMFRNYVRDNTEAWAMKYTNQGLKNAGGGLLQIGKALPGIARELKTGKPPKQEYAVVNFGITGAREFTSLSREMDQIMKDVEREVNASGFDMADKADSMIGAAWHAWQNVASEFEIAPREKVYQEVLARTGSETEAQMAAINLMDFRRRGDSNVITWMKKLVPFFNSQIQGLYKLYNALARGNAMGADTSDIRKAMFTRFMMAASASTLYAMAMQDDEEWKAANKMAADMNFLIPIGGGAFLKAPVPFELGALFFTVPVNFVRYMSEDISGRELKEALWAAAGRAVPGVFPQFAKPAVEVATNYDFFTEDPIESTSMQAVDPSLRKRSTSSEFASVVGGAIGDATGLSPVKIDHLVRGYFGALGQLAVTVVDGLIPDNRPETASLRGNPITKSLTTDPLNSRYMDQFYALREKIDKVTATANRLEKDGSDEAYEKYLTKKSPVAGLTNEELMDYSKEVNGIVKDLREQRAEIREIERDDTLSPEMKRAMIEEIKRSMNADVREIVPELQRELGEL